MCNSIYLERRTEGERAKITGVWIWDARATGEGDVEKRHWERKATLGSCRFNLRLGEWIMRKNNNNNINKNTE